MKNDELKNRTKKIIKLIAKKSNYKTYCSGLSIESYINYDELSLIKLLISYFNNNDDIFNKISNFTIKNIPNLIFSKGNKIKKYDVKLFLKEELFYYDIKYKFNENILKEILKNIRKERNKREKIFIKLDVDVSEYQNDYYDLLLELLSLDIKDLYNINIDSYKIYKILNNFANYDIYKKLGQKINVKNYKNVKSLIKYFKSI